MSEKIKKSKTSGKEIVMIIAVVILAFGLTAGSIIYLTGRLLGETPAKKTATKVTEPEKPADTVSVVEDDIVRFVMESKPEDLDQIPEIADLGEKNLAVEGKSDTSKTGETGKPIDSSKSVETAIPAETVKPAESVKAADTQVAVVTKPVVTEVPLRTVNVGKYQLQLLASKNLQAAQTDAKKYAADCPDIYVIQATVNNETWYRVRCAGNDSREAVAAIKSQIEAKYRITPIIVQ